MSIVEENRELFRPHEWGKPFVAINNKGQVTVTLKNGEVPLEEVATRLQRFGFELPTVIRFPEIIVHQANSLNSAFEKAIEEYGYQNRFTHVYPLKVNPMSHVVKTLLKSTPCGLEAGSKTELLEALSLGIPLNRRILVNGHKDQEMLQVCLEIAQHGYDVIPIIEKPTELRRLVELAKKMKFKPTFGIRVRLHAMGSGMWKSSSGERAKFGFNTHELINAIEYLNQENCLEGWNLLHFHLGSQLTEIQPIAMAIREASRIYCNLIRQGVPLSIMDVGGGLGVDYDGTCSSADSSMNYVVEEYANNVVYGIGDVFKLENIPVPEIICECGRYLVANHAMILADSPGRNRVNNLPVPEIKEKEHEQVRLMRKTFDGLDAQSAREHLHDAKELKANGLSLFDHGYLDLEERRAIECLYWNILGKALPFLKGEEKEQCEIELADQIILNLSIFQSLPDYWAVEHRFPIMPISELDKKCGSRGTFSDITCDSDGKINRFISKDSLPAPTMPVSELEDASAFYGIFHIGAYQDILGDLHNLFGPLNEVEVTWANKGGSFNVGKLDRGSNVRDTLVLMHLEPDELLTKLKSVLADKLDDLKKRKQLFSLLENYLKRPTYPELNEKLSKSLSQQNSSS